LLATSCLSDAIDIVRRTERKHGRRTLENRNKGKTDTVRVAQYSKDRSLPCAS
jgi:hypothetical protein